MPLKCGKVLTLAKLVTLHVCIYRHGSESTCIMYCFRIFVLINNNHDGLTISIV